MKPVEVAFRELLAGVAEIPGSDSNPRINEYLALVGQGPNDETPWCSAFVNFCFREAGIPGTGKPNARSWFFWGTPTAAPKPGDVVVFWRDHRDSWQGHVAFWLGDTGSTVVALGGNQGDRVSVSAYSKERVLGYRRVL